MAFVFGCRHITKHERLLLSQDHVHQSIFAKNASRVALIYNMSFDEENNAMYSNGHGTGVVWTDQNHIVTANHVVADRQGYKRMIFVQFLNCNQQYLCKVQASDTQSDLAILTPVGPVQYKTSKVDHTSEYPKVGSTVFALGHPFGEMYSFSSGIVSAIRLNATPRNHPRIHLPTKVIQIDAPINPGNSGGPIFDVLGRVIGICSYKYPGDGMAYVIPTEDVIKLFEKL